MLGTHFIRRALVLSCGRRTTVLTSLSNGRISAVVMRALSTNVGTDIANVDKWKDYFAIPVNTARQVYNKGDDIVVPKASPHHGTGLFATQDIPKGTVICEAKLMHGTDEFSGEAGFINDLNYTYSRASGAISSSNEEQQQQQKGIADMTYEDYQEMLTRYCDVKAVEKNTNVVMVIFTGDNVRKLYIEARRDIRKGEELSRLYTVQYWLDHHLTYMHRINDDSVYMSDHPLTRTLLELNDPHSKQLFAAIHDYHAAMMAADEE